MKFGPIPIENAEGKILGHNISGSDGRRVLRKGRPLTANDIQLLQEIGRTIVYVAEIEPDDVDENTAALRVATAVIGGQVQISGPSTGRCNILATTAGLLRVDFNRLARINACTGITLATLETNRPVTGKKMVGTVKILPYGVPESLVWQAERIAQETGPVLWIDPLQEKKVSLILSGSPAAEDRIRRGFIPPLEDRLSVLQAKIEAVSFIPLEDETGEHQLATALQAQTKSSDLIVLAGETAVQDPQDIAPRAINRAGGHVTCFGAPVDPGNLLLLAYLGKTPILGAPGCVRSRKMNIIDWVLPRLLVGDQLTHADIFALGHGGLLEDTTLRGIPRDKIR
ncbi:MAG: molybdopterin-binding protein [Chloroflexota bacterium]